MESESSYNAPKSTVKPCKTKKEILTDLRNIVDGTSDEIQNGASKKGQAPKSELSSSGSEKKADSGVQTPEDPQRSKIEKGQGDAVYLQKILKDPKDPKYPALQQAIQTVAQNMNIIPQEIEELIQNGVLATENGQVEKSKSCNSSIMGRFGDFGKSLVTGVNTSRRTVGQRGEETGKEKGKALKKKGEASGTEDSAATQVQKDATQYKENVEQMESAKKVDEKYNQHIKEGKTPVEAMKALENDPETGEREKEKLREIQRILANVRASAGGNQQEQNIINGILGSFTPNLKAPTAHAAVAPLIAPIQNNQSLSNETKGRALSALGVSYNYHNPQTGADVQNNIKDGRGTQQKYKMVEEPPESGNWKEIPDGEPERLPYTKDHPLLLPNGAVAWEKGKTDETGEENTQNDILMRVPIPPNNDKFYTTSIGHDELGNIANKKAVAVQVFGVMRAFGLSSVAFSQTDKLSRSGSGTIHFNDTDLKNALFMAQELIGGLAGTDRLLTSAQGSELEQSLNWLRRPRSGALPGEENDPMGLKDAKRAKADWHELGILDTSGNFNPQKFKRAAEFIREEAKTPSSYSFDRLKARLQSQVFKPTEPDYGDLGGEVGTMEF